MGGRSSHWQGPGEGEGRLEASLGTWLGLEERGQGHPLERPPTTDLGLTSGRTPHPRSLHSAGWPCPAGAPEGRMGPATAGAGLMALGSGP